MAPSTRPKQSNFRWFTLGWIVAGCSFGIFLMLLFFAPARWLSDFVARTTDNRVQLNAPQGSVWSGSAQVTLGAGKGSNDKATLAGRVFWKIRPSWQGIALGLQAECCIRNQWDWIITPTLQGPRINLADVHASEPSIWPSALLSGLGTPWNTLQLEGTLSLTTRQLSLQWSQGAWDMVGYAQLDADNMSTSLSTLKPIGSYRFTLQGGQSPYLQLTTLEGSLQLQGSGRWVNHQLQFTGEASALPDRADALANLLNIIGRREGARVIIKI